MEPSARSTYAKFSRPRVHHACRRPRLFNRLHQACRDNAVVWISSPPGAGKTTLAASYVDVHQLPHLWYQIDHQDSDPATLFHYLGHAAQAAFALEPLPVDPAEAETASHARRFFRRFYSTLPPGSVIVFDNLHEFDWDHAGHLLEIAFSEIPFGLTVLALSRHMLPARLSRMAANGLLKVIDWDELRFDGEEVQALLGHKAALDPACHAMLDKAEGWAAGIVMLREAISRAAADRHPDDLLAAGRKAIFHYFAGEVMDRLSARAQDLLLKLACLPPEDAHDARHEPDQGAAIDLIHRMCDSRWFIARTGTQPALYEFHPYFLEFLQHRARQQLGLEAYARLLRQAAHRLEAKGELNAALGLLHEAGDHTAMANLLLRNAARMCTGSQAEAWREWTRQLPPATMDAVPWLCHWHGISLIQSHPAQARQSLRRAEQAFMASGDTASALQSMAAIVDCQYCEWNDFSPLRRLTQTMLDRLHSLEPLDMSVEKELLIRSRILLGLFLTDLESRDFEHTLHDVLDLLPGCTNGNEQLAAGTIALHCLNWCDIAAARNLIVMLDHLTDSDAVASVNKISWARAAIHRHQLDGDREAAERMIERMHRLVSEDSVQHLRFHVQFRVGLQQLAGRDLAAAQATLDQLRALMNPQRKLEVAYFKLLEALNLLHCGDEGKARRTAEEAHAAGDMLPSIRYQLKLLVAFCASHAADWDGASRWAADALSHAYGRDKKIANDACLMLSAYRHLAHDETMEASACLQTLLASQMREGLSLDLYIATFPRISSPLMSLAMRERIEPDFVRKLILLHRLPPADRSNAEWPWPVKVKALGRLELKVQGEARNSTGKAQQRPMALLKALLVAGPDGAPQTLLARRLWPEAADPKAALHVTVHRLRKLLGHDGAVLVRRGSVLLAADSVWTDVDALGTLCGHIEKLSPTALADVIRQRSHDLLDLYRGAFCDGDDESWMMPTRDALRTRFLSAVTQLGMRLEKLGEWALARQLYASALKAEPLGEASYRGLMRCACAQNDPSAAYSVYRQCRQTLSVVLGRMPSFETERLSFDLGIRNRE
ncbi:BTAD domain-containing putative transcriptional regulator [Noviherbaspirillum malthae]|uniref:BTAD domain-containing putative transcriptional regulator n=1 Tax=Noviherbaspirillum malthae TaxID=1260987 RepID=UPI00188DF8DC|nr:BTAD domain-containing putative transcriptional regulator [Noviherbaspirillum malthae]